jgi:NAD(P)-dependent dehydrogenase (short-subunit alcohol dehydrogenase family)
MVLEGQVAIVTGGGQGIGKAIGLRFAREGADVAVLDINGEAAETTVGEVRELGRRAVLKVTDVSDSEAAETAVNEVAEELGGLDVLINNAGIERNARLSLRSLPPTGNANSTSICRERSTACRPLRVRWPNGGMDALSTYLRWQA